MQGGKKQHTKTNRYLNTERSLLGLKLYGSLGWRLLQNRFVLCGAKANVYCGSWSNSTRPFGFVLVRSCSRVWFSLLAGVNCQKVSEWNSSSRKTSSQKCVQQILPRCFPFESLNFTKWSQNLKLKNILRFTPWIILMRLPYVCMFFFLMFLLGKLCSIGNSLIVSLIHTERQSNSTITKVEGRNASRYTNKWCD